VTNCNRFRLFVRIVKKKCIFAEKVETMKPKRQQEFDGDGKMDEEGVNVTNITPLKKEFLSKLFEHVGNVTKTCESTGISRMTYYRWKSEDTEFSAEADKVKEAARQSIVDDAEDGLRSKVLKGDITAIIFTLKTIGKERGYVERVETENYNMTPVEFAEQVIENERKKRTIR